MADKAKHPLEGLITTIYADPITHKKKEGRATVLEVVSTEKASEFQDLITCKVHFIGDRRGYNVLRQIAMRRASV